MKLCTWSYVHENGNDAVGRDKTWDEILRWRPRVRIRECEKNVKKKRKKEIKGNEVHEMKKKEKKMKREFEEEKKLEDESEAKKLWNIICIQIVLNFFSFFFLSQKKTKGERRGRKKKREIIQILYDEGKGEGCKERGKKGKGGTWIFWRRGKRKRWNEKATRNMGGDSTVANAIELFENQLCL